MRPPRRPGWRAGTSRSTTRSLAPPARRGADVDRRCRDARRGEPRLVAARDDLGARRAGRRHARPRSSRPADAAQVAAVLRLCNERADPGHRGGRAAAACAARACRCTAACVLDLTAIERHRRRRRRRRWSLDVLRRHVRRRVRGRAARTSTASPCGHWPQSMALSTVGGWLACRGAGQLSTRYGKIEDIVVGLDVVLADGTRDHHRRRAARRGRPRPHPAVRRLRGHARRHHRRPPAPAPGSRPPSVRAAYAFTSFADGLDACRRILQRGATPAVLRLYDAIEADRSYQTGDAHLLLVLDEGDAHADRRDACASSPRSARGAAASPTSRFVEHWLEHRNDVSALEALISRGLVVDTMEIAGRWRDAARDLRRARPPRSAAVEHTLVASAHQSHSYPDGALPLLHVRGPARRPTSARRYYRAAWDAGTRAGARRGRRAQPPPRRRPQPRPLRRARRSAPRSACSQR